MMKGRNGTHDRAVEDIITHPNRVGVERAVVGAREPLIWNGNKYAVAGSPDVVLFLPDRKIIVVEVKSNGGRTNRDEAFEQLYRSHLLLGDYFNVEVTKVFAFRDSQGKIRYDIVP